MASTRRKPGQLGPQVENYRAWLTRRGYTPQTVRNMLAYLGHREPASTYWYLSAAPELLALAAARQDTAWQAARS